MANNGYFATLEDAERAAQICGVDFQVVDKSQLGGTEAGRIPRPGGGARYDQGLPAVEAES